MSALSLVSLGEHRELATGPGDTVVLSARADPRQRARRSRGSSATSTAAAPRSCTRGPLASTSPATAARTTSWSSCSGCGPSTSSPSTASTGCSRSTRGLAARAGFPAERVLVAEDGDVLSFSPRRRASGGACSRGPGAPRSRQRLGGRRRGRARPAPPLRGRHRRPDRGGGPSDGTAGVAPRDRDPRRRLRARRVGAPGGGRAGPHRGAWRPDPAKSASTATSRASACVRSCAASSADACSAVPSSYPS